MKINRNIRVKGEKMIELERPEDKATLDGVCFYCGKFESRIIDHENQVHGKNHVRKNDVY